MHLIMDQNQSEEVSIQLAKLSATLLELHRGLLDFERKNYESINGDIGSSRNFLDLLMNHPAFN